MSRTGDVATAGVFAAFVAGATMALSLSIPATTGYFNLGEVMVYTAALVTGPKIGSFAGGVGSIISDIALGFPQFAPGTLVIKGTEGYIVGRLSRSRLQSVGTGAWRGLTVAVGLVAALLVAVVGSSYYSGVTVFSVGLPFVGQENFEFELPAVLWYTIALFVLALITVAGLMADRRVGLLALSVLAGGAEMVVGYYLYERVILGNVAASVEIPFNIAQCLIGLMIAVPLARGVIRFSGQRFGRTGAVVRNGGPANASCKDLGHGIKGSRRRERAFARWRRGGPHDKRTSGCLLLAAMIAAAHSTGSGGP